MARLPRFFVPAAPLHVIQRGNNRAPIFRAHEDRAFFYGCLEHGARIHGVEIHAYVLMPNHVHLVATPSTTRSLPRLMQSLGRVYVAYFNKRYVRTGTLWEGRYKAAIVDDERYLLTCMRYVELNPVRAGLARNAVEYRWSSFRSNAAGARDALVTPHSLYLDLASEPEARQATYRSWFCVDLTEAALECIRDATQNAWVLGGPGFRRRVEASGRRSERISLGRPKPPRKVESDPT